MSDPLHIATTLAEAERTRIQRETLLALVRSGGAGRRHLIQWAKGQGHDQQAGDLLKGLLWDAQIKSEILAADEFFRRVYP